MLAFTKQNKEIISYLLNELWYFWTKSIIKHLITERFFESMKKEHIALTGKKPWVEIIPIIFRSETMHTYFKNLSYKKRKAWLTDFIMDATTSCIDNDEADHRAIAQTFRLEFTR